ncbi:MAG: transcription termination/antitermination protein NusA [Candidatus Yonathbacteria bacterium]|nr:transcription termination/antitermination protein NusA [Candidatus Yonathbacteria bacterium]NTW47564.1 transcription termination/antitermination protein NusA [Candidatus Yonathbacteria bacterium]
MFDIKVFNSALAQLEEERGIPREKIMEAIEQAIAAAYKKDYGKKDQIVRAFFDAETGTVSFEQIKIVADETTVRMPSEEDEETAEETSGNVSRASLSHEHHGETQSDEEEILPLFNPERHILVEDAKRMKKDIAVGDEMIFPLESKDDYGRIAAQTAKQVIIQKIREAEKESVMGEYADRKGDIVSGTIQRVERGTVFVDLDRATGIIPYEEQIPTEHYRQGMRIRAYMFDVAETPRGVSIRLSRSHPEFLRRLFEMEAPEVASGVVELKSIAREPGSRSKVAVYSNDAHVDPIGACVGQRGMRVSTIMNELAGEKIDIILWDEKPDRFVAAALSPARVLGIEIDETRRAAKVTVPSEQLSLAIGKGGQNARLAVKLTGWNIDIAGDDGTTEEMFSEEALHHKHSFTEDEDEEGYISLGAVIEDVTEEQESDVAPGLHETEDDQATDADKTEEAIETQEPSDDEKTK